MKKFNILLTCVGGEFGPYMINALKNGEHKVRVIGIDCNAHAIGQSFCDVFLHAPSGIDPAYPDFISKLVSDQKIDLIIPTSDEEALVLSKMKRELSSTIIATVGPELLAKLSSKTATYRLLEEHQLPCPDWDEVSNWEQLQDTAEKFLKKHSRIVVKPTVSRGGRDIFHVQLEKCEVTTRMKETYLSFSTFKDALKLEFDKHYPVVVMEELDGPVHDLDMLAWEGRPLAVVPRKRLDSDNPNLGHLVLNNSAFIDMGNEIIKRLQLSWLYDCDFMFDKKGQPKIIEINPRQSGSVAISIAAGLPLLDYVISLAKKVPIGPEIIVTPQLIVPIKTLVKVDFE
jgi:carbamoyl-phosphate synthase large subunit